MSRLLLLAILSMLLIGRADARDSVSVYVASPNWQPLTLELTRDFFRHYDIDLSVMSPSTPWRRAIQEMRAGRLDMILTIYKTPARSRYMAFTVPFAQVPTAVVVTAESPLSSAGIDELVGLRGLKVRGASLGQAFERHRQKLNVEDTTDEEMMIRMLTQKRADYGVGAQYKIQITAQKMGYTDRIRVLSPPLSFRGLRIAFSQKSRYVKFLAPFDAYLQERLQEDDIQQRIKQVQRSLAGKTSQGNGRAYLPGVQVTTSRQE
ncbi:substrate-binding periplasmic protein [Mangrovitalea sediminis]|uniref:substrate-binding periplasmic protein n=1 Tax=Mangrovitalea sediminis TaxID=1982043 RepID=UPI000BE57E3C|nr:transporter substrate-binding domain-containing protein [Mangrovitalea sediminis]